MKKLLTVLCCLIVLQVTAQFNGKQQAITEWRINDEVATHRDSLLKRMEILSKAINELKNRLDAMGIRSQEGRWNLGDVIEDSSGNKWILQYPCTWEDLDPGFLQGKHIVPDSKYLMYLDSKGHLYYK